MMPSWLGYFYYYLYYYSSFYLSSCYIRCGSISKALFIYENVMGFASERNHFLFVEYAESLKSYLLFFSNQKAEICELADIRE